MNRGKFFKCDCGCEALEVVGEEGVYIDVDNFDQSDIYFSMWRLCPNPRTFWWRLKVACRLLFKDVLHTDNLILSLKDADKLGTYLKQLAIELSIKKNIK